MDRHIHISHQHTTQLQYTPRPNFIFGGVFVLRERPPLYVPVVIRVHKRAGVTELDVMQV